MTAFGATNMVRILRLGRLPGYAHRVAFRRLFGGSDSSPPELLFGKAEPSDRAGALSSVLGATVAAAPAFERRAAAQGVDLSHLWTAHHDGKLIAATLLIPHPGRTALLMSTAPRDHVHASQIGGLIQTTLDECFRIPEIRLVQALSSPNERLRASAWIGGGMRHLATLEYMERLAHADDRPTASLPVHFRLAQWNPAERTMLEALLSETYQDTLDCPGLAELRTPADIVDGHLAAGEHDASLWTIAFENDRPVGALLLAPSQATDSTEVIYLGLIPAARGRGLGRALLAHGMTLAAQRPEPNIALAVDSRNSPALALYAHAGFRVLRCRDAFVAHQAP